MSVKAFDLVSISNPITVNDVGTVDVTSLDYCAGLVYVGTINGYIIRYVYDDKGRTGVKCTSYKLLKANKDVVAIKTLPPFSTVFALVDGALHTIHMEKLEIQSTKPRNVSAFCLNSALACSAPNGVVISPNSPLICCARGKYLSIFGVTAAGFGEACKVNQLREFNVEDTPICVAMDGETICYATMSNQYALLQLSSGTTQPLVPFTSVSLIRSIKSGEFLINGPSGLGVFVDGETGASPKAPLNWGVEVTYVAYAHPYVLCMTHDAVLIYSIFDTSGEPKQRMAFRGGTCLESFDDGRVIILASRDTLFALHPVPWETQVQRLLQERKVAEALELAQHSNKTNLSNDDQRRIVQRIQQEAGFVQFQQFNFDQARSLFLEGDLDIYELLDLFPEFRPPGFSRRQLHDIINVDKMCDGNPEKIRHCRQFLMNYLEHVRPSRNESDPVLDNALLQLYAMYVPDKLLTFVTLDNLSCVEDILAVAELLCEKGRPHAAALMLYTQDKNVDALRIWTKLLPDITSSVSGSDGGYAGNSVDNDIILPASGGTTANNISNSNCATPNTNCNNPFDEDDCDSAIDSGDLHYSRSVLLDTATTGLVDSGEFIMNGGDFDSVTTKIRNCDISGSTITGTGADGSCCKDPQFPGMEFVAKIITALCDDLELLREFAPAILDRDQKLGASIFTSRCNIGSDWLEECDEMLRILKPFEEATILFLEHTTKICNRESLHTILAEYYLKNAADSEEESVHRKKFRNFLENSDFVRIPSVLEWCTERGMHRERIILYRKMSDHSKALNILVRTLNDFSGAEEYCDQVAKQQPKMSEDAKRAIYETLLGLYLDSSLSESERNDLVPPAIDLLNSPVAVFDSIRVLKMLPSDWSVDMVDQLLTRTLRTTLHRSQNATLKHALTRWENVNILHKSFEMGCRNPLILKEGRLCPICNRPFLNATFVWLANGQTVHLHCQSKLNASSTSSSPSSTRSFKS